MPTRKPARKAAASRPARAARSQPTARAARAPREVLPPRKAGMLRPRHRRSPETLRLRSFTPGLTVDDLQRSITFYTQVLGFVVGDRWMEGDVLTGVMLKAGACGLGLSQDDGAKGRGRRKGVGVRLWCQTIQDVDALAARVKAAGFALTEEPKTRSWGARSFSLDDPDGYHLTIYRE